MHVKLSSQKQRIITSIWILVSLLTQCRKFATRKIRPISTKSISTPKHLNPKLLSPLHRSFNSLSENASLMKNGPSLQKLWPKNKCWRSKNYRWNNDYQACQFSSRSWSNSAMLTLWSFQSMWNDPTDSSAWNSHVICGFVWENRPWIIRGGRLLFAEDGFELSDDEEAY